MINSKIFKKGDWFILWGQIYKIYEAGSFSILAHHMIQTGDDYVEGDDYMFDTDLVTFNAKEFKPYEE